MSARQLITDAFRRPCGARAGYGEAGSQPRYGLLPAEPTLPGIRSRVDVVDVLTGPPLGRVETLCVPPDRAPILVLRAVELCVSGSVSRTGGFRLLIRWPLSLYSALPQHPVSTPAESFSYTK